MRRSRKLTEEEYRELFLALRLRPDWSRSLLDLLRVQPGHLGYYRALAEARRQGVTLQTLADAFRVTPLSIKTMFRRGDQKAIREANRERLFEELKATAGSPFDRGLVFEHPIENLDLPARAVNALTAQGVKTVGQLVSINETDLRRFVNIGGKTVKDIRDALAECGLSLGMGFLVEGAGTSRRR